ncbi:peptidyl-prolyl cis-trans isomerase (rotamase) - cyclophilin family [Beggiatoa alba B18LD]|uniref:Peptidyl-prolyl cis-trans isomerase n=1 Tax=Beggiatoa alba B18LD TaxID=395493 RepID=I3CBG6_9GAMM|nr:peptidyl-prolyl cis-trans isomerase (rotamase) - cyclophilin family [Beggiatoa alba B18LD]
MMRYVTACLLLFFATTSSYAAEPPLPQVEIQTSMGKIVLELYPEKAPVTVYNFLTYAQEGFYTGTIFHRVIKDFMVQGGGYTADFEKKTTRPEIKNEANNGLKNLRGTVAMARSADPDSASSQFFVNVKDNYFLDYQSSTPSGWGYTVFGKVTTGMDVVDKIQAVTTGAGGTFTKNVPEQAITIDGMKLKNAEAVLAAPPAALLKETKPVMPTPPTPTSATTANTTEAPATNKVEEKAPTPTITATIPPPKAEEKIESVPPKPTLTPEMLSKASKATDAPSKPDKPEPTP